jgi:glutamine---fructose-6-phosphate transaminase (isomerizing)
VLAREGEMLQSGGIESIQYKNSGRKPAQRHIYCDARGRRGSVEPEKREPENLLKRASGKATQQPNKNKPTTARESSALPAGQHTLHEVFSQPATWAETARQLEKEGTLERLAGIFSSHEPWLFVGCGSSYYLAQIVAAVWEKTFQIPCAVVPASELLFAADEVLRRTGARQAVLVSRSGETTEVLRAGMLLEKHREIATLGVTCNANGPLEKFCRQMLRLSWADEKSTVMTRSFTSMLLALERLGALLSGDVRQAAPLEGLPEKGEAWMDANADKIQAFAAKRHFEDFVFLGQGAHYWIAQEAGLKITEMSSSYAQVYHTLEFRHGPRSIAGRETLITFYISDAAAEEETLLVREMKELGAATLVVANRATQQLKESSDLLIELGMDEAEFARLAIAAIPAHLLGAGVGLRKGLNPDAPVNLTRAVVLGTNGHAPGKRRSA